jgi:corrinoid protein of di/trimethylamine methyltransferase
MPELNQLYEAILAGDAKTAVEVARAALAENEAPLKLLLEYMVPAMDEVGRRFQCEEFFVPDLLLSGRAMKATLELLRPLLSASGAQPAGRVVIGTVKGDLHDIGKNLVASLLEGGGFEVYDVGADVSPEQFIEAIQSRNPDIVALSALLTVTMPAMKTTIDELKRAGVRDSVKVMIGGAPVTRQYAEEIGADAYGEDASVAVSIARSLMAKTPK